MAVAKDYRWSGSSSYKGKDHSGGWMLSKIAKFIHLFLEVFLCP